MHQYLVIYDGCCNLCTNGVKLLERLDQGRLFRYLPMQSPDIAQWQITPELCEQGMILISLSNPEQRWQGINAAEEISRLLPGGDVFLKTYRSLPGLKAIADRGYAYIRDHRYALFGKRSQRYTSELAPICKGGCQAFAEVSPHHDPEDQDKPVRSQ